MSFFELRMQLIRDAESGGFDPLDAPPPMDDEAVEDESTYDETPVDAPAEAPISEAPTSDGASPAETPSDGQLSAEQNEAPVAETPLALSAPTANGHVEAGKLPHLASRGEAFQRLTHVADYLSRTEPNSPVPNMVRSAVAWGSMPFEKLMETLYPDLPTREKIGTLVGVKPGGEAAPT
jgi:predicted component of type VI protein secretion system